MGVLFNMTTPTATDDDIKFMEEVLCVEENRFQWDECKRFIRSSQTFWRKHLDDIKTFVQRPSPTLKLLALLPKRAMYIWREINARDYVVKPEHLDLFATNTRHVLLALIREHNFQAEPVLYLEEFGSVHIPPALAKTDRIAMCGNPSRYLNCGVLARRRTVFAFHDEEKDRFYRLISHWWNKPSEPRISQTAIFKVRSVRHFPQGDFVYELSEVSQDRLDDLAQEIQDRVPKIVKVCANPTCNATAVNLKKCSKCEQVLYCNKACQKAHWPLHKTECSR